MSLKLRIYKCSICGNIVQVLVEGEGELVCCGHEMKLLEPKALDLGSEKHVPVFIKTQNDNNIVKVGSEPHPMTQEHYIQFIETFSPDRKKVNIEFFEPLQIAESTNYIGADKALEYCNIHELWEGNNND